MRGIGVLPKHSIVARVALAAVGIAVVAVAALWLVTTGLIAAQNTRTLVAAVDTDLTGLADIYAAGGRAELVARIDDRLALQRFDPRREHYLLTDAAHRRIAGDLRRWPALAASDSEAGFVTLDGGQRAYARATRFSPDLSIVVAREDTGERAMLHTLSWGFAGTGAAIVAAVGLLAWRQSAGIARRVQRISTAYRQAENGGAPLSLGKSEHDEIGELARLSHTTIERLAGLVEAQRHVSDNVAHEIRTPLLHLDGRLWGLLRKTQDAETAATLARARADIRSIVAMLESLLDIASNEAQRGDPDGLLAFDISSLAQDIADTYRSSMEEAGLRFETAIAPGTRITGDAMQLTRLISNLLDNAIRYVPPGGTVRLEVEAGGALRVCDDGPGIPPDARASIFERFRRGDRGPTGGHGLGLALARAIARRHGRELRLEPTLAGCSFVLDEEHRR